MLILMKVATEPSNSLVSLAWKDTVSEMGAKPRFAGQGWGDRLAAVRGMGSGERRTR